MAINSKIGNLEPTFIHTELRFGKIYAASCKRTVIVLRGKNASVLHYIMRHFSTRFQNVKNYFRNGFTYGVARKL